MIHRYIFVVIVEPRLNPVELVPKNPRRILTFPRCSGRKVELGAGLMMKPGGPGRSDPDPLLVNG